MSVKREFFREITYLQRGGLAVRCEGHAVVGAHDEHVKVGRRGGIYGEIDFT